jgi:hypothetical protein
VIAVGVVACASPSGAFAADGSITGTVTDETAPGTAVPNFEVAVYAADGLAPLATGCTNGVGLYSIAIAPGSYEVQFSGKAGVCGAQSPFAPEWWDSHGPRAFADPVVVFDGVATTGIDAALLDGGRVSGTVTDAITALPIANVTVDVFDPATATVLTTCSAANGTYVLDPVVGGVFSARFSANGVCGNAGNYATQWFDNASTQAAAAAISMPSPGIDIPNVDARLTAPVPPADPPGGDPPGNDPPGTDPPGTNPPGTNPPAGAPDTKLDSAKVKAKKGKATFVFSGSGGTGKLSFECELTKGKATPKFTACSSPQSYKRLKKGRYVFSARAVDAAGSMDPSPATQTLKSKRRRR